MPEDFKARILRKYIPPLVLDSDGTTVTLADDVHPGWSTLTGLGGITYFLYETYTDLVGMTVEQDFSFAVQAVDWQEGSAQRSIGQTEITIWDVVTDVPVNWSNVVLSGTPAPASPLMPGFLGSNQNMENVISARVRTFAPDPALASITRQFAESNWGTNTGSASDRLYVARVIQVTTGTPSSPIYIGPPVCVAMPTVFFEESDLEHMERLRRSYILQV